MANQYLSQARKIYAQALPNLFQRKNVVACGLGYKIRGDTLTQELSLIVSVVRKETIDALTSQDIIPQAVDGLVTDVVEVGRLRAQWPDISDPRLRYRPAHPGVSIGHEDVTAGTFGFLVRRGNDTFILSNNHVLANCNEGKPGDAIYQPGEIDGGTADDRIATLTEFLSLDFGESPGQCSIANILAKLLNGLASITGSSHRLQSVQVTSGENQMDAALARVDDLTLVDPEIFGIGRLTGVGEPELGQSVQKMGRTTGLTEGIVTQIDVTVNIDFSGRNARFTDQIITTRMSAPGDSGSGILDMDKRAVGLLFAGSDRATIFTPITRILDHFGIEIVM